MKKIIRTIICFFAICFMASISNSDTKRFDGDPIFIVGQDSQSINDYVASLKNRKDVVYPDGFMLYTAINDLRGLSEPVNHGSGINYADDLIRTYLKCEIIQIGLYMKYMLKETVNGSFDGNIAQLGQWIKDSNKQVYLRIGYEFDNPENEYASQEYIQAYRYIVDFLRKMKIPNVHFVWHSIAWTDNKNWPVYDPLKWYPGDGYVDWVGISFFDSKQDTERNVLAKLAKNINKPLMIAESSPFNQYTVEAKLEWISKLFEYIKKNDVKFLSYINVDWDSLPLFESEKWGDARLETSPVLLKEWNKELKKSRLEVIRRVDSNVR